MDKQNTKSVQGTNDSSIVSKLSMVNRGYFDDPVLYHFVQKSTRRSPLINRGYYIRAKAIEYTIDTFFNRFQRNLQVLSLGAGFDSLFFRYSATKKWPNASTYYEVDFPEVVRRKAQVIQNSEDLLSHLKSFLHHTEEDCVALSSATYKLIGVDVCKLQQLQTVLEKCGIDKRKPTLVLLECVRTYIDIPSSTNLIKWISTKFENVLLTSYEQILPDDGFGLIMMNHFLSLGSPLHSIHRLPGFESHKQNYLSLGFTNCSIINMNDFYNSFIDESERTRIESLELFDEFEEWHAKCNHYILVWATKGIVSSFPLPASTSLDNVRKIFTWKFDADFEQILRFGHASVKSNSDIIVVGGFGSLTSNGGHKRLSAVTCINLVDKIVRQNISPSDNVLGARMYLTLNILSCGLLVAFGGRTSPSCAFNDAVSLSFEEHGSLLPKLITCQGSPPCSRWRHTASVVKVNGIEYLVVFGGRTNERFCSSDCFVLNTTSWNWQKIAESNSAPLARHSHSSVTFGQQIIISCGLSNKIVPLNDIHILNCNDFTWQRADVDGLLPRYSHTSHVWQKKLFLIGGVNCIPESTPGIAIIDLDSWKCTEYQLAAMMAARTILLHNHSSELNESSGEIYIVGGGGNCFSFGTHFNPGILTISLDQFSKQ